MLLGPFKGKTVRPGKDLDYLLYSGEGQSLTLKNVILDMNHKSAKTVLLCTGSI